MVIHALAKTVMTVAALFLATPPNQDVVQVSLYHDLRQVIIQTSRVLSIDVGS